MLYLKLICILFFSLLVIGCRAKNDTHPETLPVAVVEEALAVDTPLFNPDTAGYLLQLPMGNPNILKRWKNEERIIQFYRSYALDRTFCDSFLCGRTIELDPLVFKETYNEWFPVYTFSPAMPIVLSKKHIPIDSFNLYLAYTGSSGAAKVFLLSVKDNQIMDSKTIYYNVETTFPFGQLYYLDQKGKLSLREYSFTDRGIPQSPLSQWIINDAGQFVQYYTKDGLHNTQEEWGMVQNHVREGNWIEKKQNLRFCYLFQTLHIENRYTYLEAEYRAGVPVGEWRFYRLAFEEGKDPYSGGKGELVYTERYENGKMVKRSLVEGFKGDEIEYKKTEPSN